MVAPSSEERRNWVDSVTKNIQAYAVRLLEISLKITGNIQALDMRLLVLITRPRVYKKHLAYDVIQTRAF